MLEDCHQEANDIRIATQKNHPFHHSKCQISLDLILRFQMALVTNSNCGKQSMKQAFWKTLPLAPQNDDWVGHTKSIHRQWILFQKHLTKSPFCSCSVLHHKRRNEIIDLPRFHYLQKTSTWWTPQLGTNCVIARSFEL